MLIQSTLSNDLYIHLQLLVQKGRFLETRARLVEAGVEEERDTSTIKQEPDTSGDNV